MKKILLTGIVCSGLAFGCSPVRSEVPEGKLVSIFQRSCFAYGVQEYELHDIVEVVRSEIANSNVLNADEKSLLALPFSRDGMTKLLKLQQESLVKIVLDKLIESCEPGAELPKIYQAKYFSHLKFRNNKTTDN